MVGTQILILLVVLGLGNLIGYLLKHYQVQRIDQKYRTEGERILADSQEAAREIELKAQAEALQIRQGAEEEVDHRRQELSRQEDRLQERRDKMDRRNERLERREQSLNKRQSTIDRRLNEVEKLYEQELDELQRISGMTSEQAQEVLLQKVEKESRDDMARLIRQVEYEAQEEGEKKARKLIADAIQRVASEHVSEVTSSNVPLPSDEMKGRIIGRSGRNINAFEQAAGVDVIVDDTPEAVTISSFDPVRR